MEPVVQEKTRLQVQVEELQQQEVDFKQEILDFTEEQLQEREKELIAEMEALDTELRSTMYNLPKHVESRGEKYNRAKICSTIQYFLNKQELTWQFIPGMCDLYDLFAQVPEQISHTVMDTVLRTLDTLKFKGYTEWIDIVSINDYLKQIQDEFQYNLNRQIGFAHKHNILIEYLELKQKVVPTGE